MFAALASSNVTVALCILPVTLLITNEPLAPSKVVFANEGTSLKLKPVGNVIVAVKDVFKFAKLI